MVPIGEAHMETAEGVMAGLGLTSTVKIAVAVLVQGATGVTVMVSVTVFPASAAAGV